MDPNVLTAMLANMSGNMIDPATLATLTYLNQVGGIGGYQELVRQYQNSLSTITSMAGAMNPISSSVPNISNAPTMSTAGSSSTVTSNMTHLGHLGSIGGLGNLGNLGNLNNLGNLTMQQYLNLGSSTASMSRSTPTYHQTTPKATTVTTTTMTTKEKSNISITPVNTSSIQKTSNKPTKSSSNTDSLSVLNSKPSQIVLPQKTAAQVSLLKPSVIQQVKSLPPKQMSAPQIRVSKTLTEPQPAHKSSLSHSPVLKATNSTSPSPVPQAAHSGIAPSLAMKPPIQMNLSSQGSGTSLQHKLLSKKQHQQPHPSANVACPPKKQKTSKKHTSIPSNYQSLLNSINNSMSNISSMPQTSYMPAELSNISLSQLPTLPTSKPPSSKGSGCRKTSGKSKSAPSDVASTMSNPLAQSHAVEAMSMLSQLQQHSHLEIIPQHKNQPKSAMDFPMGLPSSLSVTQQKIPISEPLRPPTSDNMFVFELTRGKPPPSTSTNVAKKSEKLNRDGVEIITLDD